MIPNTPTSQAKDLLMWKLRELGAEKARLRELTAALDTVHDSKFAIVRQALVAAGSLLSGRRERVPVSSLVRASSAADGNGKAGSARAMRARIDDLQRQLDAERGDAYARFRRVFGTRASDIERLRVVAELLPTRPKISIVMATFNTPETFLRQAIDSVLAQAYGNWELCIADDASSLKHVRRIIEAFAASDPQRIKVCYREENGHISRATNSALALATGTYVGFLDHDDLLTPDALFEVALLLNERAEADIVYSDEDKIDEHETFRDPYFKPDWSPDTFLSKMYTCHFSVYRRSLVESLGGLREGFEGSQDWDLMLRASERTTQIHHIPRVLYHWRIHDASTASSATAKPYASNAAMRAIGEAIERRGEPGTIAEVCPGTYVVRYAIKRPSKVSIIIPTRDHGEDVDRALSSIFSKTTYPDFEIVLVDNGSTDAASLASFRRWAKADTRIRVLPYDVPFNFPQINNFGVTQSSGEYVLLLNNDTEVISEDWLEGLVEQAQRPVIGAVGPLLLFPDDTIQHAGVIVGIGGVAGHAHKRAPATSVGYFQALKSVTNYSAVTGACLMVRRSVYDEVGGLDERFAVAFNDIDFCLKLVAAGYRNVYLPHVMLYHHESKSRGYEIGPEKLARFARETVLLQERWQTDSVPDPYYNPNLSLAHEDFSYRNGA